MNASTAGTTAPAPAWNGSGGLPAQCGVLGGGRMGSGIAHALLLAGAAVRVAESEDGRAEEARAAVERAVRASEQRGVLTGSATEVLQRLEVGVGARFLAPCGLAVEAVPEDPALKARVLAELDDALAPGAVLATNTSSISIAELAAALGPDRPFLGLHFFNPVPASALVEVVHAPSTPPGLVESARGWVGELGKTAVVVRDAPGFASSRLGLALGLEAVRMVEEGVAAPEDIDAAMVLGYRHPIGPLRLTDLVGLDVRLGIAEHLERTLGPRFAPPQLLRDKVARGELGRKSGRGFYSWEEGSR
ncbi:3-hydroxybutyryl-CoA dehydrogenase [Kineococcus xinjiangensis]|uniref:3-hydroxybutyryl-CoA dehydrogenase n=1 Tax=Kineococcus xinjiangensis TaxID=512762 RepID=A0A2S6IK34_9ACTN|nr:3-hydroxyacyl-CoA dehydrogenase family protein [Kineococcus xinjiangensis]PPK94593.1 3-hydroxybutyryl-CoA dehydrogenase [Kineococcus xinjiangensis]